MSRIGDFFEDVTYSARRGAGRIGQGFGRFWFGRSLAFRRRTAGVIALVGLYALLKLVLVPALPCQAPGGDACAPAEEAAKLVPADALLYAHVDTDPDSAQYKQISEFATTLPHTPTLIQSAVDSLNVPSGGKIDLARDVRPWLGDEAALAELPGQGQAALLLSETDPKKAAVFADRIGPGQAKTAPYKGTTIRAYGQGFAVAIVRNFLVAGEIAAVQRVIDTAAAPATSLGSAAPTKSVRGRLPDDRFADVYLSRRGVSELLAGRGGYATQLDTFTDYSATRGIAAAAQAQQGGMAFQLESAIDPTLAKAHPPFFQALEAFNPTLAGEISDQALIYFGLASLGDSLTSLLAQARLAAPGLARSIKAFQANLTKGSKVDLVKGVLPALKGQAALGVEPTAQVPYATLIVDGVDEEKALSGIAQLAVPLARAAAAGSRPLSSSPTEREIDGVKTISLRLSPSVDLTFATFDGKLVVATDPAGIKQVRSGGDSLGGSDLYKKATESVGGKVSSLVFLNLTELFGLAERAGLAEDPAYATFSEDISKLKALGVGVTSSSNILTSKFFLTID